MQTFLLKIVAAFSVGAAVFLSFYFLLRPENPRENKNIWIEVRDDFIRIEGLPGIHEGYSTTIRIFNGGTNLASFGWNPYSSVGAVCSQKSRK